MCLTLLAFSDSLATSKVTQSKNRILPSDVTDQTPDGLSDKSAGDGLPGHSVHANPIARNLWLFRDVHPVERVETSRLFEQGTMEERKRVVRGFVENLTVDGQSRKGELRIERLPMPPSRGTGSSSFESLAGVRCGAQQRHRAGKPELVLLTFTTQGTALIPVRSAVGNSGPDSYKPLRGNKKRRISDVCRAKAPKQHVLAGKGSGTNADDPSVSREAIGGGA